MLRLATADQFLRCGGSGWVPLLGLFSLAGFIETVFWGQMSAFTPLYLPRLGVAQSDVATWTGASVALSGALGIPFLPLWGALADRYARQPVIVRSFLAHLLAGLVCLLAGNIWVFVLGRALMSLALGNTGLMMATLSERTPRERLGLAFAILNGANPVGAFVGPLVGGPVVDALGFRALLEVDALLMLAVVVTLSFGYRDGFVATERRPVVRMAAASVALIWRTPDVRRLLASLMVLFAGWMLAYTYVPLTVAALYTSEAPGTAIGMVLGASGAATLVIAPLFGTLADRVGHRQALLAGGAVLACLWPAPVLVPGLAAFAIAWALLSGLAAGVFAVSFSLLATTAPEPARARVMTFAYVPVNLGFAIGPALGGLVAAGNVFTVFPSAAVLTALGVALLASARHSIQVSDGGSELESEEAHV